jgi:hypothetical protein
MDTLKKGDEMSSPNRSLLRQSETVEISTLTPHPRNYQKHPEEQLNHLRESIVEHGLYRNVVIAKDSTILAGHGVVEAARSLNLKEVPVIRLNITPDSPKALKVLAGDNEISKLGEVDDRMLTELLKEVSEVDELLGTGFDEAQLASLVMISRPTTEIRSMDEAAEWIGLPEFQSSSRPFSLVLNCKSQKERDELVNKMDLFVGVTRGRVVSCLYPPVPKRDRQAHKFDHE